MRRIQLVLLSLLAAFALAMPAAPGAAQTDEEAMERAVNALILLLSGGHPPAEDVLLLDRALNPGNHVGIDGSGGVHILDGSTPLEDGRIYLDLSNLTVPFTFDDPEGDVGDDAPPEIDLTRGLALRLTLSPEAQRQWEAYFQGQWDMRGDNPYLGLALPAGSDRVPSFGGDLLFLGMTLGTPIAEEDDPYEFRPSVPLRIQFNFGYVSPGSPTETTSGPNESLNDWRSAFRPGGGSFSFSHTIFGEDGYGSGESGSFAFWNPWAVGFTGPASEYVDATNIVVNGVNFPLFDRIELYPTFADIPQVPIFLWLEIDEDGNGIPDVLEGGDVGGRDTGPGTTDSTPAATVTAATGGSDTGGTGTTDATSEGDDDGGSIFPIVVIVGGAILVLIGGWFFFFRKPTEEECIPERDAWRAAQARLATAQAAEAAAHERLAPLTARREAAEQRTNADDYFVRLTDALRDEGQARSAVNEAEVEVELAEAEVAATKLAYDVCTGAVPPPPPPEPLAPPPPPPADDTSDADEPIIEGPAGPTVVEEGGPSAPGVVTGGTADTTTAPEQVCEPGKRARRIVHDWVTFSTPRDGVSEVTVRVEGGDDTFDVGEDDPLRPLRDWAASNGALREDGSLTIPANLIAGDGLDSFLKGVSARLIFSIQLDRVHARCVQHLECQTPPDEGRWVEMELDCEQRVQPGTPSTIEWSGAGSTANGRGINSPGHAFDMISTRLAHAARGQADLDAFVRDCAGSGGQPFTSGR